MTGVLQVVPVERRCAGPAGHEPRRASPTRRNLKAELRIAETQTKDIAIGQSPKSTRATASCRATSHASIRIVDQRHGGRGRHSRRRAAPRRAARPERRRHDPAREARQRHLRRPAGVRTGREHDQRCSSCSPTARRIRTKVKLGRSSVNTIEIIEGLQPGDQVILSDMSDVRPVRPHSVEVSGDRRTISRRRRGAIAAIAG